MKKTKFLAVLGAVVLAGGVLTACDNTPEYEIKFDYTVKMGLQGNSGGSCGDAALNKDYFAKEGIAVDYEVLSGPNVASNVLAGTLDVGFLGNGVAWNYFAEGSKMKIFAIDNITDDDRLMANPNSEKAKDLKAVTAGVKETNYSELADALAGAKVIYEEARTPGVFFQSLVTEINENVTDDKKVWFKTIGNTNFPSSLTEYKSDRQIMTEGTASDANIPAAITSGDYDFAVSFSPTATTILSKGWKTVARTSTHLSTENIVPSTWAVNTDFLAAHTEEFKAFVRGLLQGMQFRHEDPTQVAKYIEKDVNYTTPWESIDMDNAAWPTIADQKEWCATGGMAYTYVENIRNNHLNNPDNKDKIVKTAAEACDFTYVLEAATALAA